MNYLNIRIQLSVNKQIHGIDDKHVRISKATHKIISYLTKEGTKITQSSQHNQLIPVITN